MAAILVPDVPEFAPVIEAVRRSGDVAVSRLGPYHLVRSAGAIRIRRNPARMNDAVWFSCLVGGIQGEILAYTDAEIRIA